MPIINYTQPHTINITQAEYDLIAMIMQNNKQYYNGPGIVQATKFIKDQYKLSVVEAKNIVEEIIRLDEEKSKTRTLGDLLKNR